MLEGKDSADDHGTKGAELFKKFYRGKKPRKDDRDIYGNENEGKYPPSMEPSPRNFVLV